MCRPPIVLYSCGAGSSEHGTEGARCNPHTIHPCYHLRSLPCVFSRTTCTILKRAARRTEYPAKRQGSDKNTKWYESARGRSGACSTGMDGVIATDDLGEMALGRDTCPCARRLTSVIEQLTMTIGLTAHAGHQSGGDRPSTVRCGSR